MAELQPRVLVVDDERFFREAIVQALDEAGIACDAVASGDEALRAALDPEVGVVVLDVTLADVPGIEVLRRLRAERPGLRVIVLSGQTDQELVLEALRLDASDYLAKPLHDEELVLAARRALGAFDAESSWQRLRDLVGRLEARLAELLDGSAARQDDGAAFAALAATAVSQVLDADKTSVMAFDPAEERLCVIGACGSGLAPAEMDAVALGEGVAGFALARGEPVLVDDVYLDARFADRVLHERYDSSSLVIVPLLSGEQRLGVLCATDRARGAPFGDDDVALLKVLALPVAAFLARLQGGPEELEPDEPAAAAPDAEPPAAAAAPDAEPLAAAAAVAQDTEAAAAAAAAAPDPDAAVTAEAVLERDAAELAREICEAMTIELEPERLLARALAAVARHLDGEVVALHLIDNPRGELVLEQQVERDGVGDQRRLPRDRGLTGLVLQTGNLVATDRPERDPRFDASVDTALERFYIQVKGGKEIAGKAKGLLVMPNVKKAALIIGGEYGAGALRVGGKTVDYYNIVSGSFGFQIGAQAKDIIIVFNTTEALKQFRASKGWEAGVDGNVAMFTVGAGEVASVKRL